MDSKKTELLMEDETLKILTNQIDGKVRRRTAKLEQELQIFRTLAENAASGLFLIDGKSGIVYMNPAAERAFGFGLEHARGKPLHELTHHSRIDGSAYPASECPIESALQNGSTVKGLDETFINKEGSFFPVAYSIISLDAKGMKTGAVLEFQDITERKKSTARLRRSEDRYRRLFETAQDGILILDGVSGYIADVNPFLIELLGYSRKELLGRQLWELGFFRDIASNQAAFRTLKEKGYIRYEDLPLKTKGGVSRAVEFVSNTYIVGDQRVIQCNIRDITLRKHAEAALRVSEESLRQSAKLESLGKLSGGIAHDFNNLLTVISGYANLAQTMIHDEGPLRDTLSEILKAGDRATGLTRQLLAFSRQQVLEPKILGLNAIVSDMQTMLARLIGESIRIRVHLDPGLGRVKVDLVQMQQILMNLLINARDSMPEGGEITIATGNASLPDRAFLEHHPDIEASDYVMLSVKDTGVGMDADVKARIFDPFFTTKEIGKGSGMGLATVHGIVGQSGGHITVESSPGNGSEFRIYLPRTNKKEDPPEAGPRGEVLPNHGTETVLLTEDEEMVRTLVRTVLEFYGYTVLEAGNASDALAQCGSHTGPIELLLTDLLMGGPGGRELANAFLEQRPQSRVLFMSGYTDDIAAQQGLIEKGNRFIQKPFTPAQLAVAVRDALDRSLSKAG